MNEKLFTKKIREACSSSLLKFRSFETCGNKVPDLLAIARPSNTVIWIEAKVTDSLMRKIPFEKGQSEWLRDWTHDGGYAAVVIAAKDEFVFIPYYETMYFIYRSFSINYLLSSSLAVLFRPLIQLEDYLIGNSKWPVGHSPISNSGRLLTISKG
jgi:Holliday junction resolvase